MRVLITGINGYISQFLLKYLPQNITVTGSYYKSIPNLNNLSIHLVYFDLTKDVDSQLRDVEADVVIHTAAISNLNLCEKVPDIAYRVNSQATRELMKWCNTNSTRLVYLSTDIVFDGQKAPYSENDVPKPINVYGKSKYLGERWTLECNNFAIIRLALVLGQALGTNQNFVDWIIDRIHNNLSVPLFYDEIRTPVSAIDAAQIIWKIAISGVTGTFHICSDKSVDRYQIGTKICKYIQPGFNRFKKISMQTLETKRPVDVSLQNNNLFETLKIDSPSLMNNIEQLFLNDK